LLQAPDSNALAFLDEFKLNLFADEIIVFTPRGEVKTLPSNSTALDFAYNIHSEIGNHCIGAKVNHKLVALNHVLKSGDQVEVITSKKQSPRDEWMNLVVTARAKSFIKEALKDQRKKYVEEGKIKLEQLLKELKIDLNRNSLLKLQECNSISSTIDLYYRVAKGEIGLKEIKDCLQHSDRAGWLNLITRPFVRSKPVIPQKFSEEVKQQLISKDLKSNGDGNIEYRISDCCNPIPGDEVIGFVPPDGGIWVHSTNCPEAIQLMSKYGNRILRINWMGTESGTFLSGIRIVGFDNMGLLNEIVNIISQQMSLNIRSFHIDSTGDVFEATIMLLVHSTDDLNKLMAELKKVKGINNVYRISRLADSPIK
jgi:GTP diphosphokinase / guanosine-3',5'-bis(diphosphate) 3'-diphosphatase